MLLMFLFLVYLSNVFCSNILYVAPIASPSLQRWNRALAMGLRDKGHNITMLSHDAEKEPLPKNFTLILLEGIYEKLETAFVSNEIQEQTAIKAMRALFKHVQFCCEYDYNTTGFKILQDYPQTYKFDLIIFDASYGRCFYPLIQRFNNPPAVAVTPYRLPPILSNAFGNHLHTSYVPYYNTEYSTKMTLGQRFLNFFYTYVEIMYRKNSFSPVENKIAKKQFGDGLPPLRDFEKNISLLIANIDFTMDFPMALPPNIVPAGGLHLTPSKPLPKDLQAIIQTAKNGIVFFSLGSVFRSDKLTEYQKNALLDSFGKLALTVLWKYEGELSKLPKNVIIRKFFPQNDILGHKNTKLFITHGGILSTQEAMYHAVPVIGIPFTSDARANIRRMERRQTAIMLNHKNLTSENVLTAIKEILTNPLYSKNIKLISKLFRDQPQTPLKRAIFWVQYVIRHGSVDHLILAARDMDAYATGNLDILAIFLGSILTIYLSYRFLPGIVTAIYVILRSHIQAK